MVPLDFISFWSRLSNCAAFCAASTARLSGRVTGHESCGFLRLAGVLCRRRERVILCASYRGDIDRLIVHSLCLFEVFKRVLQQRSEQDALRAAAVMRQARVVDLNDSLALSAARLSVDSKLALADSIILCTVRHHDATLWTQDAHFASLPDVRYVAK
jgi:predicted nucleic acid-binding protein